MNTSHQPIFNLETRHLAEMLLVPRKERQVVRECDARNSQILGSDSPLQSAQLLELYVARLVIEYDRQLAEESNSADKQRVYPRSRDGLSSGRARYPKRPRNDSSTEIADTASDRLGKAATRAISGG